MTLTSAVSRAALAGGLLLAGTCLSSAEELTFWMLNYSSQASADIWAKLVSDFEAANPGTKITIVNRGTDDHKTAIRVAAGTDKGPDIYFMWAGLGLGGEYVKAGLSLPLDKYYAEYKWDDELMPAALSFSRMYPGGRHGVPSTFRGEAIYYNKALFEKAGITSLPANYDEMVAGAEKLKAAGIPAITFGGTVNWHVMRLMDVILESKCGAEKHDALKEMTAKWSDEACAAASFTELEKWGKNYILSPFMGIDDAQAFNLFVADRAAMVLEGDWLVGMLDEAGKLEDVDFFPFPTGTNRLYGFADYNYVSSKSKNPDLAAKFLDYLASTPVQQEALGSFGTTSVNKNVVYGDMRPLDKKWLDVFNTYGEVYLNGDQAFPLDVTTEYFRIINEVVSGNMAPADAVKAMQTFIDNKS
ncbi:ABC transporter substrate-binding protein [Pleomorphomonas diazotrophica]|uniref:ABC transporter substrate-binding protein n=1 Tax=Pleomorphomonas diazotrophica TaxID=1166257 RepID=A0A1I4QEL1_9HYPH|nr:extracellular solute-binding protein [Pleomorphomonas diazotrophica]PKR90747.1 ABC transporter substrate-binding protein [Pleomorphomonas diazotrophica]SFM38053.1 carbohydrate ABC transporter substrate-binding protein, CUT1 family [Pleomorphomonas diazotrophica]